MKNEFLYFWFDVNPATTFPYAEYAFAFIAICFLASFVLEYFRRKQIDDSSLRKSLKSVPSFLWWIAVTALIITWARFEGVSFLGMRILWILIAMIFAYKAFLVFKNYNALTVKKARFAGKVQAEEAMKKYLPKKKK